MVWLSFYINFLKLFGIENGNKNIVLLFQLQMIFYEWMNVYARFLIERI